jgi:hypothetical protein
LCAAVAAAGAHAAVVETAADGAELLLWLVGSAALLLQLLQLGKPGLLSLQGLVRPQSAASPQAGCGAPSDCTCAASITRGEQGWPCQIHHGSVALL